MKKIILFIVITLTLMLIPKAYAASTVEEISNINIPPLLSEKKYVCKELIFIAIDVLIIWIITQ